MNAGARRRIDVAIVGSGPAALYTAAEFVRIDDPQIHVNLIERLPVIGGLARSGVAPDHWTRRQVIEAYEKLARSSGRFHFYGNVEIGRHLSAAELAAHHHAVIYAVGASEGQRLDIAGEDLHGCLASSRFVGWYNGHPDHAELDVPLDGERAVVIGNGNVALDVARILLRPDVDWDRSDISPQARRALAASRIREVCVLGRRGPEQAAFTNPELLELAELSGVCVQVDASDLADTAPSTGVSGFAADLRRRTLETYARRADQPDAEKRLRLRFLVSPLEILGPSRVEGVRLVRNRLLTSEDGYVRAEALPEQTEELPAGLVVHAVGYRGSAIPGLPFDARNGVIPSRAGRVLVGDTDGAAPLPGHYVVGWIKRGPRGVIGSNKSCAKQTVNALMEDLANGVLPQHPKRPASGFAALLGERQPAWVGDRGWRAIDHHERASQRQQPPTVQPPRPRRKLTRVDEMLRIARPVTESSS